MQLVGSSYTGQLTLDGKRFDKLGQYTFANGNLYVGEMLEGMFHGNGVIFFRKRRWNPVRTLAKSEPGEKLMVNEARGSGDEWDGLYRGMWQHGWNVRGFYVFGDGLVYAPQASTSTRGTSLLTSIEDHTTTVPERKSSVWSYCNGEDHRLWGECLIGLTPVQPRDSVLGGLGHYDGPASKASTGRRNQQGPTAVSPLAESNGEFVTDFHMTNEERRCEEIARLWLAVPVVDSCTGGVGRTAPAFAEGQPRTGEEAEELMGSPNGMAQMQNMLKIPTLPFGQEI